MMTGFRALLRSWAQAAATVPETESQTTKPVSARRPWFLEVEAVLLVVLVAGIYFVRLTDLGLRGEETRRAQIAREMMATGDWIVPRQQGELHLSRPPLQNWLIALAALARGKCDAAAIRLPTVLAILCTTLLLYGYSRTFLSRLGALAAGAAYPTMCQVLELGHLAETDTLFTLLVSASLLVWHWGYTRAWPATLTWMAGYGLAALGTLAKGPQAPIYFVSCVGLFLLVGRQWRVLWSWAHLGGVLTFLVVVAAWQVPFYCMLDWACVHRIWTADSAERLLSIASLGVLPHLVTYPVEILACTMPWSLLLLFYATRPLRPPTGTARCGVCFLATCLAVTFPSCWLVAEANSRYFMPLYPCMAPLIGLVVQRCLEADPSSTLRRAWNTYLRTAAGFMTVIAAVVALAGWLHMTPITLLVQPASFPWVYAVLTAGLAGLALWSLKGMRPWRQRAGLLSLAVFLGLTYNGLVVNSLAAKIDDLAPAVARVKQQLPEGQRLVSFAPVHHGFAYYYGELIDLRPWPWTEAQVGNDVTYFCFNRVNDIRVPLPFAWEEVAEVPCRRYRSSDLECVVVIGRRVQPHPPAAVISPGRKQPRG